MNCFSKKNKLLECSICLETNDSKTRKLECKHKFHQNCIEKWLENNNRCPMCNQQALPLKEQLEKDLKYLPAKYRMLARLYS
tara:strand:- start:101 stop:346 length:246 start_codon:yes stop_codon:yes gene_type:complete